jgi:hypothetical protein
MKEPPKFETVIKRMLATPPKPHKPSVKANAGKVRTKQAGRKRSSSPAGKE